jgi:hypothetical protein
MRSRPIMGSCRHQRQQAGSDSNCPSGQFFFGIPPSPMSLDRVPYRHSIAASLPQRRRTSKGLEFPDHFGLARLIISPSGRTARRADIMHRTDHADLAWCSTVVGSVKENVEPCPRADLTQIFPPCSSMIRFEIASPRPVPPFLRVIELSAC